MRLKSGKICLCICAGAIALVASQAAAQPNAAGWESVKRMAPDQSIRVRSLHGSATCDFDSADETGLFCTQRSWHFFAPMELSLQFRRADIRSVRLSRQALSTLGGAAAGVGLGAAIGLGVDASAKSKEDGHLATAVFVLLGGMFGAGVGKHADFLAGPLVYQAP